MSEFTGNTGTKRAEKRTKRFLTAEDGGRRPFTNITTQQIQRLQALRRLSGSDEATIQLVHLVWPSTIDLPPDHLVRKYCEPVANGTIELDPKVLDSVRNDVKQTSLIEHRMIYDRTWRVWDTLMQSLEEGNDVDYKMVNSLGSALGQLGDRVLMEEHGPRKEEQKYNVGSVNIISSRNPAKQLPKPRVKVIEAEAKLLA